MKKRIAICTTIIAFVVFAAVLGVSVYAAFNRGFGINNTISFEGGGSTLHFELDGWVDGCVKDSADQNKYYFDWSFDGNSMNPEDRVMSKPWDLGSLTFDTKSGDWSQFYISYNFEIANYGENAIKISYEWAGFQELHEGLVLTTYVNNSAEPFNQDLDEWDEYEYITINGMDPDDIDAVPQVAGLTVVLKLAKENGFSGSQQIDFLITIEEE